MLLVSSLSGEIRLLTSDHFDLLLFLDVLLDAANELVAGDYH